MDAAHDAVATARHLGFVSVLLEAPVDRSPQALRALLEPVASSVGGTLDLTGQEPIVKIGQVELTLEVGDRPFPREQADCRFWPAEQSLGSSFVCIQHGLPRLETDFRRMTRSSTRDEWARDGRTRQRLRFAAALLRAHGIGVIGHAAGQVAWTGAEWLRRLADLDNPAQRAFTALIDIGRDRAGLLFTQGMDPL